MSGRPGSGAPGEEPGAPKDEGLSIFGPLELPRDESGGYPVYDDQDAAQGPGNPVPGNPVPGSYPGNYPGNYGDGNYGGGYGDAGGTRIATPSMIVPPDPGLPPVPPPAYPGGPPPGYPSAPGQQAPQGWPGGAQASPQNGPQYGPQPSAPADDPFAALFRPGPSAGPPAGPAAGPAFPPAGQASYSAPPPPVSGQPQYAAPAMPPRHHDLGPGREPGNSRRTPLIVGSAVAAGVLVVAALFAGGVFDGGDKTKAAGGTGSASPTASANNPPPPPPTTAPAKTQAQQMDELLEVSAGSRTKVAGAVTKIERCDDIATAVQTLNDAAAQRDQQVKTLATLKTDQIPRGDELVEWLRKAWEASARADRSFAAWGQENAEGECEDGNRAKSTDDKRDANKASGEATTAKNKAVAIWNAVARTEGLDQRTATEI